MRIAIVDDSPVDRVQLLECLTKYFAETKTEYETTCYEDAKDFLENYHYTFDFIILDIDMPGLSGINAAKILREKDPNVTLMFVTKMPQYAIEAYSVEAMDYMLKPVSYPDFCLKMKKAERYILRNSDAPILLQTTEGKLTRNASQILYVESRQHYLYYHTKNECLKVRGKLSDASGTLLPYHFARAGESFLVNLSHVKGLDGADVLVDGDRVPVSRRYRTQFLSAFTRYMGGFYMLATYVFEELRFPMELLTLLLVFLLPFAQKKREFFKRAALGFLLLTLISLLFFPIFLDKEAPRFRSLSALWYTLLALSAYFYARFCFVITRCDALFFNIAAFMSQNIVYCIYHCYIARVSCPWLRTALPLYIAGAVLLTALLSFLIALCFKKILNSAGGKLMEDSHPMFLALLLLFVFILICLFFYQGAFESRVSFFDSLAWLSGELVCIFLLIIQYSFIAGIVRVREKTVLENMLRSSEKYYELSKEHIAIINRKCHDLKHQLKALEKAGEQDRSDYIKEAERSINFYQSLVYTDNEALNTILAEKGLFCQEKNIVFRCSVDDVNLSFIRLPDLYAILGNAIDNAIEYVETLRDPSMRAISMRIEQKNMFIGIQIANPYTGEKLISDELPKTHKDDVANHGFGMKSIRYLAEKYGGHMEFSTAGGLFTLQILLPVG